jgi:hypothetical protein
MSPEDVSKIDNLLTAYAITRISVLRRIEEQHSSLVMKSLMITCRARAIQRSDLVCIDGYGIHSTNAICML